MNEFIPKTPFVLQIRKIIYENFNEDDLRFNNDQIFEIIKDRKLRMMPTSSEIKKFLKSNKEYMDLLPIGVRL